MPDMKDEPKTYPHKPDIGAESELSEQICSATISTGAFREEIGRFIDRIDAAEEHARDNPTEVLIR